MILTKTLATLHQMPDSPLPDMIGGAFGLELPTYNNFPHPENPGCVWLNSGRAALECLLHHMPRPQRVLVPLMVCNTVLEPIIRLGLPIIRYSISEQLAPILPQATQAGDLLLLVNYFGLRTEAIQAAALRHPGPVVVDATMALYTPPLPGIPTFYSPRKFGGLSDGGVAHAPFSLSPPAQIDHSAQRALSMLLRTERGAEQAQEAVNAAEAELSTPMRSMSPLTRRLIAGINWESSARCRLANYATLHRALAPINRLQLPTQPTTAPMCYPLVCGIPDLRDELIDAGVALPLYWPEVLEGTSAEQTENRLARTLLPLPIDQRYTTGDMERLIRIILG